MNKDSEKKVKRTSVKSEKKVSKKTSVKKKNKVAEKVNKPMNVDEITLEEADSFYHISLLVQAICVVGVLFVCILTIFEHSFVVPIEVLVGVTLLIMAYNNSKLFKRKNFTVIYIIFGVLSLIVGILGYFGVTM